MTWDIAKAALDDFIVNSLETEMPILSFYGGEPLLAYDLIKKCVDYLKNEKKQCRFGITTNGSLINEENIRYFIDNDFKMYISLDGPKDIHDRYRVLSSGDESWEIIQSNIKLLKNINKKYFSDNLTFVCTIAPPFYLKKTIKYFNKFFYNHLMIPTIVDLNSISYLNASYTLAEVLEEFDFQIRLLSKEYFDMFTYEDKYTPEMSMIARLFDYFPAHYHKRIKYHLSNVILAQGQCYMGSRRLFCDVKGFYHPCERVTPHYNIGSIFSGVNYDRIYKIIKMFNENQSDSCNRCPFIRFCKKCIKDIFVGGSFNQESFNKNCKNIKARINNDMILYMKLFEEHPSSLNKTQHIVVS